MTTRPRPRRRPSTIPCLLVSLLLSLLFTFHGVFITRNYLLSSPDNTAPAFGGGDYRSLSKYFQEDDDNQWRLDVMMGRGAPFDTRKRNRGGAADDDDDGDDLLDGIVQRSNDDVVAARLTNEAPAAEISTEINQDEASPTAAKITTKKRQRRRGSNNNNNTSSNNNPLLRPRRDPKGHRFRGWRHPNEFNIWDTASERSEGASLYNQYMNNGDDKSTADTSAAGSTTTNPNPNDKRAWWRNNSRCFEIDYICHRPHINQWRYMTSQKWKHDAVVFQPTMELKPSPWKYDGPSNDCETRIGIKVDSPTLLLQHHGNDNDDDFSFGQCQLSDTPTHIVLQSIFNDMVGEFYSRSLLGLHQTMMMSSVVQDVEEDSGTITEDNNNEKEADNDEAMPPSSSSSSSSSLPLPWEEDVQFYIHIPLKGKQVLDGHKLLTSGMLSNPKSGMTKSFLDLFVHNHPQQQQQQQPSNNDDEDDCQCYRKMVFCGYDVYTHDEQVNSEDIDFVEHYDGKKKRNDDDKEEMQSNTEDDEAAVRDNNDDEEEEEEEEQINPKKKKTNVEIDVSNNPQSSNPNLKYTLWSAGTTQTYQQKKESSPLTADCIKGEECQGYANLRNFLSSNFLKHYPNLSDDIVTFRREALLANSLIKDDYSGDTTEWLVVGLTQRTYRRVWLNLPTVMKQCNTKFNDRGVVFIEVNVEETSSPYEQLVLHRSLDVMVGVHGAQLTQAVVLPPHAHVLEILPWVPSYIRGHWVTRRDAPTPLGIIYHNSDLNHAGYSLDRTSTDLCVGVGEVGSEEEKDCFLSRRKIFIWDNRDFNVEPEVIIQYIEKLVLFMRDDEMGKLCSEVKDRLDERFVLYNIWCKEEEEGESTLSVSHYYAKTGPPNEKEQYGMSRRKKRKASSD